MDTIIVLDFGGQYCHLITRRILDLGVFSRIMPSHSTAEELRSIPDLKGIIISGGAASIFDRDSPKLDREILSLEIPILGICFGHQLIAHYKGASVFSGDSGEYGITELKIIDRGRLLLGLSFDEKVWMNHRDIVKNLPPGLKVTSRSTHSPVASFEGNNLYGVQFHPEVSHTPNGPRIFENFINITGARKSWTGKDVIENIKDEIRETIGTRKAVIGLSGGIDSALAAHICSSVMGERLKAVYVDTGLMRYRETEFIRKTFSNLNLVIVDAKDAFFSALDGISDPEKKRKTIGKLFIDIFEEYAKDADFLIQGTIYSDRIESGITKHSSTIKSHHNVGGLPADMRLTIYEPLRNLYKDEVRKIAREMSLPAEIIRRHVFPGPGLAVRIAGEVTKEKAEIARKANFIVEEELKDANLYDKVWMGFAILLSERSVGVEGDERSYKYPIVVRVIESKDAMTANYAKLDHELLERISTRITNEIREVNRVLYDISNKPPATMEWE